MERKLTKEQRNQLRITSMMFVSHGDGNEPVTSALTTVDLCRDLDDADAEIERLRNALRTMMRHYVNNTVITPEEESELVALGVLDKDKCFITEEA